MCCGEGEASSQDRARETQGTNIFSCTYLFPSPPPSSSLSPRPSSPLTNPITLPSPQMSEMTCRDLVKEATRMYLSLVVMYDILHVVDVSILP